MPAKISFLVGSPLKVPLYTLHPKLPLETDVSEEIKVEEILLVREDLQ